MCGDLDEQIEGRNGWCATLCGPLLVWSAHSLLVCNAESIWHHVALSFYFSLSYYCVGDSILRICFKSWFGDDLSLIAGLVALSKCDSRTERMWCKASCYRKLEKTRNGRPDGSFFNDIWEA